MQLSVKDLCLFLSTSVAVGLFLNIYYQKAENTEHPKKNEPEEPKDVKPAEPPRVEKGPILSPSLTQRSGVVFSKNPNPPQRSYRIILANYGSDERYARKQKNSCDWALAKGGADACISYSPKFLDRDFKRRNRQLLSYGQGAGYWIWKPYVIFETLLAMQDGDFLFYSDCDWNVINPFDSYIALMMERKQDVVPFYQSWPEKDWTKSDAYVIMGMDDSNEKILKTSQLRASYGFFRRTPRAIRFVGEWLTYVQDPRVVSNDPSVLKKDPSYLRQNRHDQTVYSLLLKKWNITNWPDPMYAWRLDIGLRAWTEDNGIVGSYNPIPEDTKNHPHVALVYNCAGTDNICELQ